MSIVYSQKNIERRIHEEPTEKELVEVFFYLNTLFPEHPLNTYQPLTSHIPLRDKIKNTKRRREESVTQ